MEKLEHGRRGRASPAEADSSLSPITNNVEMPLVIAGLSARGRERDREGTQWNCVCAEDHAIKRK